MNDTQNETGMENYLQTSKMDRYWPTEVFEPTEKYFFL